MASITVHNKTGVAWLVVNSKANHGTWNTEPDNLSADDSQVTFGLDDTGSPFGVDGYVEYAGPGEGSSKAMARIIFKSPSTNINIVKAHITDSSYEALSEYDVDGDLVGMITFRYPMSTPVK